MFLLMVQRLLKGKRPSEVLLREGLLLRDRLPECLWLEGKWRLSKVLLPLHDVLPRKRLLLDRLPERLLLWLLLLLLQDWLPVWLLPLLFVILLERRLSERLLLLERLRKRLLLLPERLLLRLLLLPEDLLLLKLRYPPRGLRRRGQMLDQCDVRGGEPSVLHKKRSESGGRRRRERMAGEFVRGGGVRERDEATRRAWTRSCVAQGRRNIGDDLCPPTAGSRIVS